MGEKDYLYWVILVDGTEIRNVSDLFLHKSGSLAVYLDGRKQYKENPRYMPQHQGGDLRKVLHCEPDIVLAPSSWHSYETNDART